MPLGKGEVITIMKYSIVLVLILGSAAAQPNPAPAKTTQKTEAKKNAAPVIPADAEEVEPNIFKHTDNAGKVTYYRRSPFGVAYYTPVEKGTSNSATRSAAPSSASTGEMTGVDQGDSVKFTRPGPFGLYTWIRKKSEMSDDEKAAFEKSKSNSSTAKSQSNAPKKDQ